MGAKGKISFTVTLDDGFYYEFKVDQEGEITGSLGSKSGTMRTRNFEIKGQSVLFYPTNN